ncbi:MAG TPA: hypothetical protein EYP90_14985, partial [Chromatiaceae bacterium]|nr:hypothetical protein [Chromatiaceae bacterium]
MDEQKLLAFVRGCDVDFRTDNGTLDRWYTSSGREFARKLADMPLYDADNSSNSLLHQHLVVTLRPEAVSMFISEALGELLDVDGNAAPRNGKGVATALAQIVRRERDDRYPDGVNPAKILFIFKIMERMAVNTNPEIFSRPEEPINGHNAVIEISKAAIPSWNPVEYRMFPNVANELAAYVLASIHGKTVGNTKKLAEQHLQEAASQQKDEDMRIWGSDVMLPLGVRGTAPALLAIHREALQARFDDDRGLSIHQTRVLTALQGLPPQAIYESLGMLLQAPTEAVPPHVLLKKYSSGVYGFTFHPESSPIRAILALGHLKTPEAVGKLAMGIRTLYVPLLNGGQFEKMPACARLSLPTIQQ